MDEPSHIPHEKTLAMGRRWARAFARATLTDAECMRVARAYVEQMTHHKTATFVDEASGLVLARLDRVVQVADAGQLWVFRPRLKNAAHTWTSRQLVRAYHEHRADGLPGADGAWLLHSFNRAAHELAEAWSWRDLKQAFRHAQVEGGSSHDFFPDPAFPDKVRMIKGYSLRSRFYQGCIGLALRPLRQALAGEALTAVWGTGNVDGALFHWLQAGATPQQQLYRRQALRAQPALLPLVLTIAGVLPNQADREDDPEHAVKPSMLQDQADALARAIDEGQRLAPALVALLNQIRRAQHIQTRVHARDHAGFAQRALEIMGRRQWTEADVRILGPHRPRHTLSYPRVRNHLSVVDLPMTARLIHHLGSDRQPRTMKHWSILETLSRWLELNQGQMPDDQVARVLQGCPVSWDDPFYHDLGGRLRTVDDTLRHLHHDPQIPRQAIYAAARTLSLRQWFNFSGWAHEQELAVLQEATAARHAERQAAQAKADPLGRPLTWTPVLPGGRWSHALGEVVELLSPQDTEEEGRRMSHCVGSQAYVAGCLDGQVRLLSVRSCDPNATPLSTVELLWDHERQRPIVAQHFGFHNQDPPDVAKRMLRDLMRQVPDQPWPEHPLAHDWRLLTQQGLGTPMDELLRPFRATLWGELVRRYPQVWRTLRAMGAMIA